jgi:DNA-binding response OmpR family regulator
LGEGQETATDGGSLAGNGYSRDMRTVLLVADRQSVIDQVHASLSSADVELIDHPDSDTAAATAYAQGADAVIVDMRVGSMGAMAVARDVRAKAGGGEPLPVTILLDREVDAFLAGRSGASNWLLKNAPASELEAAIAAAPAITP